MKRSIDVRSPSQIEENPNKQARIVSTPEFSSPGLPVYKMAAITKEFYTPDDKEIQDQLGEH